MKVLYNTIKIFENNKTILIPLNADKHWSLLVIDNENSKIWHYDSLGTFHNEARENNLEFLRSFSKIIDVIVDLKNLKEENFIKKNTLPYKLPSQGPTVLCGCFVMGYIWAIILSKGKNGGFIPEEIALTMVNLEEIRNLKKGLLNLFVEYIHHLEYYRKKILLR
jgi:Ulp1 family protease